MSKFHKAYYKEKYSNYIIDDVLLLAGESRLDNPHCIRNGWIHLNQAGIDKFFEILGGKLMQIIQKTFNHDFFFTLYELHKLPFQNFKKFVFPCII